MKASTLLASSAFVALTSTAAISQAQPPPASDFHVSTKASMAAPQNAGHNRDATPPAPRGDLRGDIASNVRARPDSERDSRSQHH